MSSWRSHTVFAPISCACTSISCAAGSTERLSKLIEPPCPASLCCPVGFRIVPRRSASRPALFIPAPPPFAASLYKTGVRGIHSPHAPPPPVPGQAAGRPPAPAPPGFPARKPGRRLPRSCWRSASTFRMPRSRAISATRAAVWRLAQPGSTTTSMVSTPSAVPRPRCSTPASMSTTTCSWLRSMRWSSTSRSRMFSGHAQPLPAALDGAHDQHADAIHQHAEFAGNVVHARIHFEEAAPALAAADALLDQLLQLDQRSDVRRRDSPAFRPGWRRGRRPRPPLA